MTQQGDPIRVIELYLSQDKPEKALALLNSVEVDLENWGHWFLRSRILSDLGQFEQALKSVKQAIQLNPGNPFLFAFLGRLESECGNLAKAETALLAALREKPDEPDFLTQYALLVAKAGQLDKADRLVQKALRIEPDSQYAVSAQSILLHLRGEDKAAAQKARQLLEKDPENLFGKLFLGKSLAELGQLGDAHRHVFSAARQEPGNQQAVDAARKLGIMNQWLLWPLKPLFRFDGIRIWLAFMALFFVLKILKMDNFLNIVLIVYIIWVLYTWIISAYIRYRIRRLK